MKSAGKRSIWVPEVFHRAQSLSACSLDLLRVSRSSGLLCFLKLHGMTYFLMNWFTSPSSRTFLQSSSSPFAFSSLNIILWLIMSGFRYVIIHPALLCHHRHSPTPILHEAFFFPNNWIQGNASLLQPAFLLCPLVL